MVGRKTIEINRGGEKINPEEIELALDSHGKIRESCCFGIEHPILGQQVAVAIVRNHNESCTEQDVIEYLTRRLRYNIVPESIFFLETIPKSDRGKIDRSVVKNECVSSVSNVRR